MLHFSALSPLRRWSAALLLLTLLLALPGLALAQGASTFAGGANLTTDGTAALDAGTAAAPAVTDVDGNGRLDLLMGNNAGNVQRYEQTAANGVVFAFVGSLTTDGSTALNVGTNATPAVTDVDGDGRLDLLVGNGSGNVQRYEQTAANGGVFALVGNLTTDGTNALDAGDRAVPAVTDVDGNGRLDLLVGNLTGNVQRYEQTAANGGVFALVGSLTTDGTATLDVGANAAPAVTDVDGNGRLDLLLGNSNGNVRRYEQTAANGGVFALVGNLTTDGSTALDAGSVATPAVTDVDDDGRLDLLVGNSFGNVERYEQLTPPAPTLTGFAPTSGPVGTSVTITGTNLTSLTSVVLRGIPCNITPISATQASFVVPAQASTGPVRLTATGGNALSGSDFTVTRASTSLTYVLRSSSFNSINVSSKSAPAFTDLDHDGLIDLLVGRETGEVSHYEQSAANSTSFTLRSTNLSGLTGHYNAIVSVTDIDGDGLLEMVVGSGGGNFKHYEQTAANSTSFTQLANDFNNIHATAGLTFETPHFTDIDGDGLLDLLVGDEFLSRYEQTAANGGTFTQVNNQNFGPTADAGNGGSQACVVDLDGDGRLDMLIARFSGQLFHYEQNSANSTAFTQVSTAFSGIGGAGYPAPAITDLDGDGLLDLILGGTDGVLRHYEQAGTPTITFFAPPSGPPGTSVTITGTDLAGATAVTVNGVAGTITANTATSLTFTVGAGNTPGTFAPIVVTTPGGTATSSSSFTVTAPLTILSFSPTRNQRSAATSTNVAFTFDRTMSNAAGTLGAVKVFSQQRGGRMQNGARGTTTVSSNVVSFNPTNDFKPGETVFTTVTTAATSTSGATLPKGQVQQFTAATGGTGRGNFLAPATNPNPAVGANPQSVALGDVDGDGDLDLLTANYGANTVSVRLNDGTGNFIAPAPNPNPAVGNVPISVAVGDMDGDGDLDLLTANVFGNTVSVRLNQPVLPTLTALSPAAELPGQAVTLTGTGFTAGSTVSFGGVAASSVSFISATSLTAAVPVGATPGSSAVVVSNGGSSSAGSPTFEVLQVYRNTAASGCLATDPLMLTGSGGTGAWRYLRLPGTGGAVVAAIEDTRNLGTVSVGFTALGTGTSAPVRTDGSANRRYLDRNFYLTATNQTFPGQSVRVRFFGLNSELSRLTAADGNATAANLKASQYSGPNEDCDLSNNAPAGDRRLLAAPATVLAGTDWFTAQATVTDHFSEFYLTGASAPLPVELLSFTAEKQGSAVALAWRTASETNSARFEVERSADGKAFARIGELPAQGSKASPTTYTFLDEKPTKPPIHQATTYYRLRQVDQDGTASYSPVRVVDLGAVPSGLSLYPNPARTTAQLTGAGPGTVVAVFDALGREVTAARTDAAGTALLALPPGLPTGVYVVRSGSRALRLVVE